MVGDIWFSEYSFCEGIFRALSKCVDIHNSQKRHPWYSGLYLIRKICGYTVRRSKAKISKLSKFEKGSSSSGDPHPWIHRAHSLSRFGAISPPAGRIVPKIYCVKDVANSFENYPGSKSSIDPRGARRELSDLGLWNDIFWVHSVFSILSYSQTTLLMLTHITWFSRKRKAGGCGGVNAVHIPSDWRHSHFDWLLQ